jgi:acetolactate synthase-1/3 small subunit
LLRLPKTNDFRNSQSESRNSKLQNPGELHSLTDDLRFGFLFSTFGFRVSIFKFPISSFESMMNTFVVYVENKPGVLTRVASLFRRRAFNIDSLTVGRTEKPEVSRMTITVDADRDQARRIEANLYKLVNVLLVDNITNEAAIVRDLAMIKVAATHEARSHVLELASVFRARVVDVAPESLTIEITGAEDKIDGLLEVLRPYGVLEMVRTGIVGMRRGNKSSVAVSATNALPEVATDEDVSYSV